jgi:hypothetical protein
MRALLRRIGRRGGDEKRGQIVVMFGLGLIVFLGFAALTVDIGFLLLTQRSYQNAADEAALAGAVYLTRPISDPCADTSGGGSKHDCARAAAWRYLDADLDLVIDDAFIDSTLRGSNTPAAGRLVATNGGGDEYRLWVSTPPNGAGSSASMSTVADSNKVIFVRVDRVRSPFIAGVLGIGDLNVSSWATAGIFPNRWAVITLRRGQGGAEIDSGPANTTDMVIAGSGSSLVVRNGDVGGNFGLKMPGSGSRIILDGGPDEANVYLIDHLPCSSSACWSSGQIVDTVGNAQDAKKLPSFVADPNYLPPPGLNANAPNGPVDNPGTIPDIPRSPNIPSSGPDRDDIVIKNSDPGSVSGTGCSADSPVLGPGWVQDINIAGSKCLILRGDVFRTDMYDPATEQDVPLTQMPGVLYVTGQIRVGNDALIVADGVTIVIRPDGSNGQFTPTSGGVMDINRGNSDLGVIQKLGAWTTMGISSYTPTATNWVYNSALESDPRLNGVGIALYVLKSTQVPYALGNGTDIINVSSGSGLAWNGVTYAPNDNVKISGQPNHDGIGQLISWTFTFDGGVQVTQTFDGPGDGPPYLIEPCVIVAGSCQ